MIFGLIVLILSFVGAFVITLLGIEGFFLKIFLQFLPFAMAVAVAFWIANEIVFKLL